MAFGAKAGEAPDVPNYVRPQEGIVDTSTAGYIKVLGEGVKTGWGLYETQEASKARLESQDFLESELGLPTAEDQPASDLFTRAELLDAIDSTPDIGNAETAGVRDYRKQAQRAKQALNMGAKPTLIKAKLNAMRLSKIAEQPLLAEAYNKVYREVENDYDAWFNVITELQADAAAEAKSVGKQLEKRASALMSAMREAGVPLPVDPATGAYLSPWNFTPEQMDYYEGRVGSEFAVNYRTKQMQEQLDQARDAERAAREARTGAMAEVSFGWQAQDRAREASQRDLTRKTAEQIEAYQQNDNYISIDVWNAVKSFGAESDQVASMVANWEQGLRQQRMAYSASGPHMDSDGRQMVQDYLTQKQTAIESFKAMPKETAERYAAVMEAAIKRDGYSFVEKLSPHDRETLFGASYLPKGVQDAIGIAIVGSGDVDKSNLKDFAKTYNRILESRTQK